MHCAESKHLADERGDSASGNAGRCPSAREDARVSPSTAALSSVSLSSPFATLSSRFALVADRNTHALNASDARHAQVRPKLRVRCASGRACRFPKSPLSSLLPLSLSPLATASSRRGLDLVTPFFMAELQAGPLRCQGQMQDNDIDAAACVIQVSYASALAR